MGISSFRRPYSIPQLLLFSPFCLERFLARGHTASRRSVPFVLTHISFIILFTPFSDILEYFLYYTVPHLLSHKLAPAKFSPKTRDFSFEKKLYKNVVREKNKESWNECAQFRSSEDETMERGERKSSPTVFFLFSLGDIYERDPVRSTLPLVIHSLSFKEKTKEGDR